MELTGGCLCGAVRFRVTAEPLVAYYCHCTKCQKNTSSAFVTSATVPIGAFQFTKGKPRAYESSPGIVRLFCGDCGTPLGLRAMADPKLTTFRLGCLDDPNAVKPEFHLHTSSQISWCQIADDLPHYPRSAPKVDSLWGKEGG
jgi:hypothetical protein